MSPLFTQIILGFVQGVTEWLPISSSGHLALLEHLLGLKQDLSYDLFLHLASLVVMLWYFRKDIAGLIAGLVKRTKDSQAMTVQIILATAVTVVVALIMDRYEQTLRSYTWIALSLMVNALVLYPTKGAKENRPLSMMSAVIVGFVQGIAAVPAISRSALTIGVALLLGIRREDAFRFSFLIAIPALAAAIVYKVPLLTWNPFFLVGFGVTAIVGYGSLWVLDRIMRRNKLHLFWMYNVLLAILILIYAR